MATLNGRIIGQAERATRALFDRLLSRTGTPFEQWVAINLTVDDPGTLDELVTRMAAGLKTDTVSAAAIVEAAVRAGYLTDDGGLTPAGRQRFDEVSADLAVLAGRLYGGLTPEELDIAGRVLSVVTDRANAELAAA